MVNGSLATAWEVKRADRPSARSDEFNVLNQYIDGKRREVIPLNIPRAAPVRAYGGVTRARGYGLRPHPGRRGEKRLEQGMVVVESVGRVSPPAGVAVDGEPRPG